MPEQTPYDDEPASQHEAEPEWQRRRRLAAVFGDVLPETTSDEDAGDRWLRSQVPPHHG